MENTRVQNNNWFHRFKQVFCATIPCRSRAGEGKALAWVEDTASGAASWWVPWIQLFFSFCRLAVLKSTKTLTYGQHGEEKIRGGLTLRTFPVTQVRNERLNKSLLLSTRGLIGLHSVFSTPLSAFLKYLNVNVFVIISNAYYFAKIITFFI